MEKIAISTSSFGTYDSSPLDSCREYGYDIVLNPYGRKVVSDELIEIAADAVGLIAGTESINEGVMSRLPSLKVISRCGAGIDNVDLAAAEKLGIKVFNTPDGPTFAVAELTIGLMLNLLRKVNKMDQELKGGKWKKEMGNLLYGKKVGIIGFGRIGQKVAQLLDSFGANIAYYDLLSKETQYKYYKLDELLGWADIISLHLSGGKEGSIIGKKEIDSMRKGSWLINVSRGGVVDEDSLFDGLTNGTISGAAVDVFKDEPYKGKLLNLDNVVLTPHIGSYAKESRILMEKQAVDNLLIGLGRVNNE